MRDIQPLVPLPIIPEEERERIEEALLNGIPAQNPPQNVTLDKLVIEETSPRDAKNHKILYFYNQSLNALKARGFERHLRPVEAFQILIYQLENPNSRFKDLAKDMLSSYGEWTSLA